MRKRLARSGLLEGSAHDQPAVAASVMIGSLFLLGFQDALVKLVSSEVSLWQFQMLGAALCYAATILTTRRLCRDESPVTLAMAVAVGYVLVGGLMTLILSVRAPAATSTHWPYLFTGRHNISHRANFNRSLR